jgi:hypothetical protein
MAMKQKIQVDASKKWSGPNRNYDIIKEGSIALVIVLVLVVGLSILFSSPDEKAVSLASWSKAAPADFVQTATGELAGTTTSAGYGAPYNKNGSGQQLGPLKLQQWVGVHIPVNPAQDFVLAPLSQWNDDAAKSAVTTYEAASADQQSKWANAYATDLGKHQAATSLADPGNKYGPVPTIISALLSMSKTGALDGALTTSSTPLPTDFTKPLLFLADGGSYFSDLASKYHLNGDQWGVMNETGSWPGQSWLWLFSFWYQINPFKSSGNADVLIFGIMGILTLCLALIPFIPVIRKLPYRIPFHKLIWKDWYRSQQ